MSRKRADHLLFEAGLAESREKAKRLIMAGLVSAEISGRLQRVDKPGQQLPEGTTFTLAGQDAFVSRGGEKLETALDAFGIDVSGLICLDAGASTGGFTDCLLQRGAKRVYAVDVGTNQLHEKLHRDPRVVSMEKTNLRHAGPELLPEPVEMIVADVSFISLTMILPACLQFLKAEGRIVALIKPQFELDRSQVGKGGVVRDESLRRQAVDSVTGFCRKQLGLAHEGTVPSKITGPKGNQEYLALFILPAEQDRSAAPGHEENIR